MAKKKKGKGKPYFLAKPRIPMKTLKDLVKGQLYWVTGFFYNTLSDKIEIVEPFGAIYPVHCQGEIDVSKMELANKDVGDITNYLAIQLLKGDMPRKMSIFIDRVDAIQFVNGLEKWLESNPVVKNKLRGMKSD